MSPKRASPKRRLKVGGRPADGMGRKATEVRLGPARREALRQRAEYESARNRLAGLRRRVFSTDIIVRAIDAYLEQNPPRPDDAITAAMEQTAQEAVAVGGQP